MVVTDENLTGLNLVGCSPDLPSDLAPLIILDASGRVRDTYRLWEEHRGGLRRLPSATVNYGRLTIRHWDQSASRDSLRDAHKRDLVLRVIADMINASPDGDWLVVHQKHRAGQFDIPQELLERLANPHRVHFVHWGNHHGSNAYRHCRNVVLLSLWDYSMSAYLAAHIAASGEWPSMVSKDALDMIRMGEIKHNLLQALCRSAVRNSTDGTCGDCTAYIIASGRRGLSGLISETFPGCSLETWLPVPRAMSPQALEVAECVLRRFSNPKVLSVPKGLVREEVGLLHTSALSQVTRREDFQAFLDLNSLAMRRYDFVRVKPLPMPVDVPSDVPAD